MFNNIVNEDVTIQDYQEEHRRLRTTVLSVMSDNERLRKLNRTYRVKLVKKSKEKLMENIKLTKRNIQLMKTNSKMQHEMNKMKKQIQKFITSGKTVNNTIQQLDQQLDDCLDINLKCPITMCDDDIDFDSIDLEKIIEQEMKKTGTNKDIVSDKSNVVVNVVVNSNKDNKPCECSQSSSSVNNPETCDDIIDDTNNNVEECDQTTVPQKNVINSEDNDESPNRKKNRRTPNTKNVRRNKRRSVLRNRNKK